MQEKKMRCQGKVEIWRSISDYQNYEISSLGGLRKGDILLKTYLRNGYLRAALSKNGKKRLIRVLSGGGAQLIDFLLAVRLDFDTILVFATSDHADPSPVPEIQVWWLEEGRITQMRRREAAWSTSLRAEPAT